MALSAIDIKNDDTTDAGVDLVVDGVSSPSGGSVPLTKIDVGAAGTSTLMASGNPLSTGMVAPGVGLCLIMKNITAFAT